MGGVVIQMKTSDEIVRQRAARAIEGLSKLSGVRGILCYGSYAAGTFDDRSDIDLYVFCEGHVPAEDARRKRIERIEGAEGIRLAHAASGWPDQWCPAGERFQIDGVQIDVTYNTLEWITTVVTRVTGEGLVSIPELRFRAHTMLGLLENSLILYDPDSVLTKLRSLLHPYPVKLKQRLRTESLSVAEESLQELRDYVERDIGNSAFHFHLGRVLDAMGTLLFAINERYDPATKRAEEAYRQLAILPEGFATRYDRILETPLTQAGRRQVLAELQALIDDLRTLGNMQ